jgi:hypothetical protein
MDPATRLAHSRGGSNTRETRPVTCRHEPVFVCVVRPLFSHSDRARSCDFRSTVVATWNSQLAILERAWRRDMGGSSQICPDRGTGWGRAGAYDKDYSYLFEGSTVSVVVTGEGHDTIERWRFRRGYEEQFGWGPWATETKTLQLSGLSRDESAINLYGNFVSVDTRGTARQ